MDTINFEDFAKIDMRIGTVVDAQVPEWSHWVIKLTVDFGEEIGKKTCFSGIMKFFTPEQLTGNQYPFVVNLAPKKIGPNGDVSECMMIMAVPVDDEETPTVLFTIPEKVANGTIVR